LPKFQLRDYQIPAVDAAIKHIASSGDNFYIKAAGGAGKSVLIAAIAEHCYDISKRVLILARNEKLLTQNRNKFSANYPVGLYCAGLGEKDLSQPITIASIQSIYNKSPKADIILVDEAQNIHPDSESETQYHALFKSMGNPQIVGFTATDWRTASGLITWGAKIHDIPFSVLVELGYLCHHYIFQQPRHRIQKPQHHQLVL
jgi:superfamily II DNA or RNA helicase